MIRLLIILLSFVVTSSGAQAFYKKVDVTTMSDLHYAALVWKYGVSLERALHGSGIRVKGNQFEKKRKLQALAEEMKGILKEHYADEYIGIELKVPVRFLKQYGKNIWHNQPRAFQICIPHQIDRQIKNSVNDIGLFLSKDVQNVTGRGSRGAYCRNDYYIAPGWKFWNGRGIYLPVQNEATAEKVANAIQTSKNHAVVGCQFVNISWGRGGPAINANGMKCVLVYVGVHNEKLGLWSEVFGSPGKFKSKLMVQ